MLVSLLLLQTGWGLLVLQAEQFCIVWTMQHEKITDNAGLEEFEISLSDFKKNKVGFNEIICSGKRYDIKSATITGGRVKLLALYDQCEEDIVDDIIKTISKTNPSDQKSKQPLIDLLTSVYLLPTFELILTPFTNGQPCYNLFQRHLPARPRIVISPPPEIV